MQNLFCERYKRKLTNLQNQKYFSLAQCLDSLYPTSHGH